MITKIDRGVRLVGLPLKQWAFSWMFADLFEIGECEEFPHGASAIRFPYKSTKDAALRLGPYDEVLRLDDLLAPIIIGE